MLENHFKIALIRERSYITYSKQILDLFWLPPPTPLVSQSMHSGNP